MPATWPSTLPTDPLVNAVTDPSSDGIVRSSMDAGPARVRNRYTPAQHGTMQVQFYLTDRQARTLRTFYRTTLQRVGTFTFEDIISDESREVRFLAAPSIVLMNGGLPADIVTESDPAASKQRLFQVRLALEIVA